ncbi:MAG: hypothetical protein Q9212_004814 [Teloschistes hypoglaucus]
MNATLKRPQVTPAVRSIIFTSWLSPEYQDPIDNINKRVNYWMGHGCEALNYQILATLINVPWIQSWLEKDPGD